MRKVIDEFLTILFIPDASEKYVKYEEEHPFKVMLFIKFPRQLLISVAASALTIKLVMWLR